MLKKFLESKNSYFTKFFLLGIANLSMLVTTFNINTTCNFITHQSKLPEKAKKLRKF